MTMSYIIAVREATCKLNILWILCLCIPQDLCKLQRKLATAQEIHRMVAQVKGDKTSINQIISDICKFVTDECCHVGGTCFYDENELATDNKFVRLCNWRTQLNMKDYKLPELD